MKMQLLVNQEQHDQLDETMKRFNEICNYISIIAFQTKTTKNKIKLHKECYYNVREIYKVPAQMVVRAIGKVVEGYKGVEGNKGAQEAITFGPNESVVYDTRLLAIKWIERVSITTLNGREEIPFLVNRYRKGSYDKRVPGQADLIVENNQFYLLLIVSFPDIPDISSLDSLDVEVLLK